MSFVIGTAGHIDHGKTSLVRHLTGQDTDRLPAEKDRGISIDLGFAEFRLPDGTPVGLVDVPGHERFIRNMVAGAHGLDLVLFVVAADDGVMPQTEEHFDILCSLGVSRAIFVITKTDMVDQARLAETSDEIALLIADSPMATAQTLTVSNATGQGIASLKTQIQHELSGATARGTGGWFRMPIDRVFSIQGRGVVITGTVVSGTISRGDEIAVEPGGARYRVRGLQCFGSDISNGVAGQRVAINLTGATRQSFHRGDVACDPAIARATQSFDVAVSVADHARTDLVNGQRVRLHLGTAERRATAIILGAPDCINGGATGLVQFRLNTPLHLMAGDRFVIRDEQGEHTLGGGRVLDPVGQKLARQDGDRLTLLAAATRGDWAGVVELLVSRSRHLGEPVPDVMFRLNLARESLARIVAASDDLVRFQSGSEDWIASRATLDALIRSMQSHLADFHDTQPTQIGQSVEVLHNLLAGRADIRLFRLIVDNAVTDGDLIQTGSLLALPTHQAGLTQAQQQIATNIMAGLDAKPFSPTAPDLDRDDVRAVVAFLDRQGTLVRVTPEIVFSSAAYGLAETRLTAYLDSSAEITVAEFRDLLGTTRKFALALLESFDRNGRTIRVGEVRKRGRSLPNQIGQI